MASHSWHRRADLRESGQAFHAFQHYRDLPMRSRSLDRAYTACLTGCPRDRTIRGPLPDAPKTLPEPLLLATPNWKKWRKQYLWEQRVADFDSYVDDQERLEARDDVKKMNKRHANLATGILNKVVQKVQTMNASELTPGVLHKWFTAGVQIERVSRGQPTEIIRQSSELVDLSKLTEEELNLFIQLSDKANGGMAHE